MTRPRPVRRLRAAVYDAAIVRMTSAWYRATLEQLDAGCRLLDVGIGTGAALVANADIVRAKDLRIVGIDIDAAYVERCRALVEQRGLAPLVEARLESVYDHRGGPYDAVYFSGSFMLLPDPPAALRHVAALLRPGGRVCFTQTFEQRRSRVLERAKPLLRLATTIDFGRVTYEHEFRRAVELGGMRILEMRPLGDGSRRHAMLAVAGVAAGYSGTQPDGEQT